MEQFLLIFELIGTVAFAASGALVGIHKDMDVFGVCILGLTTACGGGMVRDVLLGNTPPAAFQNPTDSAVAVVTALILFLSGVRHLLMGNQQRYDLLMLLMDSAGLGIFTVMGVRVAWHCAENPSLYLLVFVGAVTGVGGGLMRDIMAGDTPYIFVKHIYACASLAGALLCGLLWQTARGNDFHAGRSRSGIRHSMPFRALPLESAQDARLSAAKNSGACPPVCRVPGEKGLARKLQVRYN